MTWQCIVNFLDHWQTLITGLIALVAAIITVRCTLAVERRKAKRELEALRKSLAVELRLLIPRALGVHGSLTKLGSKTDGPITAKMVESLSRMPVARIITTYRTPDDIHRDVVLVMATAFLEVCNYSRSVLPKFRTGVASHDDRDNELLSKIEASIAASKPVQPTTTASAVGGPG